MNRETRLQKQIRIAVNRIPGVRVVRNTTGFDERARARYGLGKGGADLVGIVAPFGRAIAIEVKAPGARTDPAHAKRQEAWRLAFMRLGGFACVAMSVEDADAFVRWVVEVESTRAARPR